MIDKQAVLQLVASKGPLLPRDVVRELGGDTFITGAVLSQLVDGKEIKLTFVKIGGSPVYYAKGQEEKLQDLYKYLHEKEKKAYDKLKQEKIIRDVETEPVIRVALRNIRDFSKPLEVNVGGEREIFWKWYLLPNAEAEPIIRKMLSIQPKKTSTPNEPPPAKPEQAPVQPEVKKVQQKLVARQPEENALSKKIHGIFQEKKIEILEENTIRKNSEIDMIIMIPSPVGKLRYYCKIRDKKKSTDKDLSGAFVEGQMKKMPVLYVTTGELTKKASEMLEQEFKMISVMEI